MKKIIVYIDAGHGGIHPQTGKYMTPAHIGKLYTHEATKKEKEFTVYEGLINRQIAEKLMKLLEMREIPYRQIHHDYYDRSNIERCSTANNFAAMDRANGFTPIFLSFHSNAFGYNAKGKGENPKGWSVWTTKGNTESDKIAEIWDEETRKIVGEAITYRADLSDGDSDFEENFTVLIGTAMPAVLVENLFYTNREDAKLLLSVEYQQKSALAALNTIIRYGQQQRE